MQISFRTLAVAGTAAAAFGGLLGFATADGVRMRATAQPIYPRATAAIADAATFADDVICAGCVGYRTVAADTGARRDSCFDPDWTGSYRCTRSRDPYLD